MEGIILLGNVMVWIYTLRGMQRFEETTEDIKDFMSYVEV